jgi:DNA-directed RNA polymerase subunit RPC12/RpoP
MKEKRTMKDNRMRCPRCDGAMVFERFQATMEVFYAWRCLNCGEIMDPVVAKNREQERNPKRKAVGE